MLEETPTYNHHKCRVIYFPHEHSMQTFPRLKRQGHWVDHIRRYRTKLKKTSYPFWRFHLLGIATTYPTFEPPATVLRFVCWAEIPPPAGWRQEGILYYCWQMKWIMGYTHILHTTWWRISAIQQVLCSFDEAFSSKVRLYNPVCGIDGIGIGPVYGMGQIGWHVDIDSSWSQVTLIHDSSLPPLTRRQDTT